MTWFFQESDLVLSSKKRCLEKLQNSHDLYLVPAGKHLWIFMFHLWAFITHKPEQWPLILWQVNLSLSLNPRVSKQSYVIVCMYLLYDHLTQRFLKCECVYEVQSYFKFTIPASGRKMKFIYQLQILIMHYYMQCNVISNL